MENEANFERSAHQLKRSKWNRVNPLSKLFFFWLWPMFYKAFRRDTLHFEDVFECPPEDQAESLSIVLEKKWHQEIQNRAKTDQKPKFRRALFRCFLPRFIPIVVSYLFQELIVRIGQAILLGIIINYFTTPNTILLLNGKGIPVETILAAIGFVACAAIGATLNQFNTTLCDHVGLKMRIACSTLIYKKSLQLSQASLCETSVGQVTNLLANDVNRMIDYAYFAHSPIVAPAQLLLVSYLLWRELSWSCLLGLGFLFCCIPLQGLMGRLFQSVRSKTAPLTDTRIRIVSEVVAGIKLIKMYAWERVFIRLMSEARLMEIAQIRNSCHLKGVHLSMYYVTSRIVLFICFIVYVYLGGGALTAHKVFVSMALFNVIRIPVTRHLPQSIAATAELGVACQRKFLLLEQVVEVGSQESKKVSDFGDLIRAESISASWDLGNSLAFTGVSFAMGPGELLTVVGPVGSGKTSLLMALLRELPVSSGHLTLPRPLKLAYVPQNAWIFMGTIRENILLGEPWDAKRFTSVIRAVALDEDLDAMPARESTLVGEKGYKLSGGQKARLNLARALYSDADLYLLDDPLSALDTKVARTVVQRCIREHLAPKACILVTHQVQFIPTESSVLMLDGHGRVVRYVRGQDLVERKELEADLLQSFGSGAGDFDDQELKPESGAKENHDEESEEAPEDNQQFENPQDTKSGPYSQYFKAGFHWFNFLLILVSVLISQALSQGCDYFLSAWTLAFEDSTAGPENLATSHAYPYIYTGLIVGLFLSSLVRASSFFTFCMAASARLYNRAFSRAVSVPIQFYHRNPAGRILNRFSRDIGIIDDYVPATAFELKMSVTDVLAILVIETIIDWRFAFPAAVFIVLMTFFSSVYLKTARELKRLEAIARNPIFSHINTTFDGLTVIRSARKSDYFTRLYYRCQDFHTSVHFSHICATRGFAIIVEWLCVVYIAAVTVIIMIGLELSGSMIGLSLSSCILLVGVTSWGVECRADLESQMSSVERVSDYIRLKPEFNLSSPPPDRSTSLFQQGSIAFSNVSLSYNRTDRILQDLTFRIEPREKIGIVGRTGAGKSSIITALFRLVDACTGQIEIDGQNIAELNLERLRGSLSTIPQDPVLFTGTIRSNLDLYREFSDDQLWLALEEVQLKPFLVQANRTLDSEISEGGANLSVGQRQLLCLARAMLSENRILILDEATSSLDHDTDRAIQEVMREKFAHCTVITVAHRLNSVIDADRIMVLDAGRLVEFGAPWILLEQKEDSVFRSLVERTGEEMAHELRRTAKQAFESKKCVE